MEVNAADLGCFTPTNPFHLMLEPFDDETHPRLRFSHRGLVAMANNGEKNSNTSQFFITLGAYSQEESLYLLSCTGHCISTDL
jgi:cyclophilin family peptidyl-prolyl cis-trans isomerase